MARYAVVLMSKQDMNTGKGKMLYQGDSEQAAKEAMMKAWLDPENVGKVIRTYDYILFGGGMKDTEITGPEQLKRQ